MNKLLIKNSVIYYVACLGMHLLGIVLLSITAIKYPGIIGMGLVAYSLGIRHAFDADHIAAIDNTVRKLVHQKKKSEGVGFFFSLGHSTVVFIMAVIIGISVKWAKIKLPFFEKLGGQTGTIISGIFLLIIATFNFVILISLFRSLKKRRNHEEDLNTVLRARGPLTFILKPLFKITSNEKQMYLIGFLFGLGFDTATEIALIAMSAGMAKISIHITGVLSLPILFAAGMCLMDTTDSVAMSSAYKWAFDEPLRKFYYNMTVTLISVIVAFVIGIIELAQVSLDSVKTSGIAMYIKNLDFNNLGIILVVLFAVLWIGTSVFLSLSKDKNIL